MNVLQALPTLVSGGVETGTVDIAKALVEHGHQAIVVSAGGPMVKQIESVGARHITLSVHSKNPIVMWRNAKKLKTIIRDNNIDIIHARSRAPAWSCYWATVFLKTKGTSIPFVTTFHGTYGHHSRLKRWYNGVMLRSSVTIAVSNFIAQHIQNIYPHSQKHVQVIHRGIDTDKFNPAEVSKSDRAQFKQQWEVPENKTIIMLPGRITRWKGHAILIEAIAQLKSEAVFCLMVGDEQGKNQYRSELDQLIKKHRLERQIKFVGGCNNMPAAYGLADIVVSASTDPEAFGRVACEAQAMECLVVATNHGGSTETIAPCQQDFLCQPGDIESMKKSLSLVIGINKAESDAIFTQSRDHIASLFSLKNMCDNTLALYRKLLEDT